MVPWKSRFKLYAFALSMLLTVAPATAPAAQRCADAFKAISPVESNQRLWDEHFAKNGSAQYRAEWLRLIDQYSIAEDAKVYSKLKRLGFYVRRHGYAAPAFKELVESYLRHLDELKIAESDRILPAAVIKNKSTGELKLVTPSVDKWPEQDPSHWEVLMNERLSSRLIIESAARGRWPVFSSGLHDIFHLIVFSEHPSYARGLRAQSKHLDQKFNAAYLTRSAYTFEILALGDPAKARKIERLLSFKPKENSSFADFKNALDVLPKSDLMEKAEFWATHLNEYLIYYGGGMASPSERKGYSRREYLTNGVSTMYETVVSESRIVPDRMITEGLSHVDVLLDTLTRFTRFNSAEYIKPYSKNDPQQELERLIRLQVARTEYALWRSSTVVTIEQWNKDMLQINADPLSPSMTFVRDVYGEHSLVYRYTHGLR